MNNNSFISIISAIRERANKIIELELKQRNMIGILPAHGNVLHNLFINDGKLLQSELVEKTGRVKSTITGIIDTLEANGYVERDKSFPDKRNTFVVLTEKGRSVQNAFYEISEKLLEKTYKDIPENEQEQLKIILLKILKNMNWSGFCK